MLDAQTQYYFATIETIIPQMSSEGVYWQS